MYDGCPKSYAEGVWWEETVFGNTAVQECPADSRGSASRKCHIETGWEQPDMFNCVSDSFSDLKVAVIIKYP